MSGILSGDAGTVVGMQLGESGFNERIVRLHNGSHVFIVSHIHALDGRTFIIRSRLHAPINAPIFARDIQKFAQLKPDGRTKAGRKLAGRD